MFTSYPSPNTQQSIFLLRVHEPKDLTLQTPSPNSSSLTPQRALITTHGAFSKLPFALIHRLLTVPLGKTFGQWDTKSEKLYRQTWNIQDKRNKKQRTSKGKLQLQYFIINNNNNAVNSFICGKRFSMIHAILKNTSKKILHSQLLSVCRIILE